MLEQIDLDKRMPKKEYKKIKKKMKIRLGELQRKARDLKIPIIIVFEGWDASGKGTLINKLILPLDPRGFKVYTIKEPNEEERMRPFLWRFWTKIPARGRIAIFDRSWYERVLEERIDCLVSEKEWLESFEDINAFERMLVDDGYLIVKFFLHISKEEQKKRFETLESNPSTAWRVTKKDWKHHQQYETYLEYYEKMLEKTNNDYAPWTIVEAHDKRLARVKITTTLINAIESKIEEINKSQNGKKSKIHLGTSFQLKSSVLDRVDLSKSIKKKEYKNKLKKYQKRVRDIEHELYIKRIPMVIVYEGWDAAGKGGNIRRLTKKMDPRGYEVVPIAAPTPVEKNYHYLWRFWKAMPKAGHITIFDRS